MPATRAPADLESSRRLPRRSKSPGTEGTPGREGSAALGSSPVAACVVRPTRRRKSAARGPCASRPVPEGGARYRMGFNDAKLGGPWMSGLASRWRPEHRYSYLADAVLGAVLLSFLVRVPVPYSGPQPSAGAFVVVGTCCLALVFRRRQPTAVLAISGVGLLVARLAIGATRSAVVLAAATGVALYTVVCRAAPGLGLIIGLSTALGLWTVVSLGSHSSVLDLTNLNLLAGLAAATVFGDTVHHRRANMAAIEDRAWRAERHREEEAERRVLSERLRIARELHDVVAHHVALIQVQSGVAVHLLHTDPDASERALAHVRRAGQDVLVELGTLLTVLRSTDDPAARAGGGPAEPAPGLGRLAAMLVDFRATGLDISVSIHGERVPLPAACDLVAYRLIQEGLTNAHKHGGGRAEVTVIHRQSDVVIGVLNTARAGAPCGQSGAMDPGRGLLGMRERVASVGGTLQVGPEHDGNFLVRAKLPCAITTSSPEPSRVIPSPGLAA